MNKQRVICTLGALLLSACAFDPAGLRSSPRREAGPRDLSADEPLPSADIAIDGPSDFALADRRQQDWAGDRFRRDWSPRIDVLSPDRAQLRALVIYGDALGSDWDNYSWGSTVNLDGRSPVKVGSRAANVTYNQAWAAFSPSKRTAISTAGYRALTFWVHNGSSTGRALRVTARTTIEEKDESGHLQVIAPANQWTYFDVPLSSLGSPTVIRRVCIMNDTDQSQPMITIDELRLVP